MTALWWFGAIAAFGALANLLLPEKMSFKAGFFWVAIAFGGAAIMYATY